MELPAYKLLGLMVGFSVLTPVPLAFSQAPPLRIQSFSVGPDQTLSYPSSLANLPDEHTTLMPPSSPTGPYLLFGASNIIPGGQFGAVVLQTTDLINFDFATASGYTAQVMAGPMPLLGECDPAYFTEFDGYAAPGSVVQDPTLPAGNFIMIYEAENHCSPGMFNMEFYATAGFARSSDGGKTWPAPINGIMGGPARHPVLQSSDPQPSVPHGYEGDALPSAFVDLDADGNYYIYVTYAYLPATGNDDGRIRMARARLGADPLNFEKWYNGSFSQPGVGGSDSGVTPSTGCGGGQTHSEINYNDGLGLYLLIVVCTNGPASSRTGGWYYSATTSLSLQDWTTPQLIENSQFPVTLPCPGRTDGQAFDGFYPSSVSPGAAAGHTGLTGYFFLLNGCGIGARQFMSRAFTIVTEPNVQQTSIITFAPLRNVVLGVAPFTITATTSSSLIVSFASNTPVVCKVAGNTVTIVAAGTCSITASQGGNPDYLAATPVTRSFAVATAVPTLTCPAVTSGEISVPFNSPAIAVSGGTAPYTFSVATGTLPAGLTLAPPTGAITGAPTATGTFTIMVTDATGVVGTNTCPFTITAASAQSSFMSRYASNTGSESYINITNTGASGAPVSGPGFGAASGNICVNVYAFDLGEELISCCSCPVTPDQTVNLGVNRDLLVKTLTGVVPTSVTVKLLSTLAGGDGTGTSCTNSAATVTTATLGPGTMAAWGTTLHATPTAGTFATTESAFTPATLNPGELASIGGRCAAILGNGSGFGVCNSCLAGALGATKLTQ